MSDEPTNFLYPFIDAEQDDAESLLADLAASAQAKATESLALRRSTLEVNAELVEPGRHRDGTPLYRQAGACSPSETAAAAPIPPLWRRCSPGRRSEKPLPAWSLTADQAIVTALGNDVGFELVFARQLIARARPATSPSPCQPAVIRRTCSPRSPRRDSAACTPSVSPAMTAAHSPTIRMWMPALLFVRKACTGFRKPKRYWAINCGRSPLRRSRNETGLGAA